MTAGERPLVVLVHGAWAAGWVWDAVVPLLDARGIDASVVELPGSAQPEERSTIEANVERVTAAIGDREGRVFLVGHSGGGITVSAAGEVLAGRLSGVVFVAGIMLPSGVGFDALRDELGDDPALHPLDAYLEPALGGRGTTVPPEVAVATFFPRAEAGAAIAAARRLEPQWNAGLDILPAWTPARFGALPRLYVEAREDRDIPLRLQRHMQQRSPGATVVTLDSDHAPQLSAPEALVAELVAFIERP
jgi:pimeloyl-ACP methyl ester carboxylesterase